MKDYASEIQNILFIQSWIEWRRIHQLGSAANFNWIGSNYKGSNQMVYLSLGLPCLWNLQISHFYLFFPARLSLIY